MNFLDQALSVLDQIIVPAVRETRREPRKKSLDCALLRRICFGHFLPSKLHIKIPRACQAKGCRQIDRQQFRTFGHGSEPN